MRLATIEEAKEVYDIIRQYKIVFAGVRFDSVQRRIKKGNCVFDSGVVITFTRYKRGTWKGEHYALPGEVWIHQIANKNLGSGEAERVLKQFCSEVGTNVLLCVRDTNARAKAFYEKCGMKEIGGCVFNGKREDGTVGPIQGILYCYAAH